MRVNWFRSAATLTFSVALAGVVAAQGAPPQGTSQPPTSQEQPKQPSSQQGAERLRAMDGQTVTLTGCLVREADAPGQKPSTAERAGIAQDFVLTDVQMRQTSPSGTGTPGATPGASPTMSVSGVQVKLEGIEEGEVEKHVNQQVEVTGRLDVKGASDPDTPEINVTSIKPTGQSCTPKGQ